MLPMFIVLLMFALTLWMVWYYTLGGFLYLLLVAACATVFIHVIHSRWPMRCRRLGIRGHGCRHIRMQW